MEMDPSTPLHRSIRSFANRPDLQPSSSSPGSSVIFSPSAAAKSARNASDWALVNAFLSRVFNRRAPEFERSEEVLRWLLEVVRLCEEREEEVQTLRDEKKERMVWLRDEDARIRNVLDDIGFPPDCLDSKGQIALDSMASLIAHAKLPTTELSTLIAELMYQQQRELALHRAHTEAQSLVSDITAKAESLQRQLDQLNSTLLSSAEDLEDKITEWTSTLPSLRPKTAEYTARSTHLRSLLERSNALPLLSQAKTEEIVVLKLKDETEMLEAKVRAYGGLPTDLGLAGLEVEGKRRRVRELRKVREDLYARML